VTQDQITGRRFADTACRVVVAVVYDRGPNSPDPKKLRLDPLADLRDLKACSSAVAAGHRAASTAELAQFTALTVPANYELSSLGTFVPWYESSS